MIRRGWIDPGDALAVVQQCALAGVSRATVYAQQKPRLVDESDFPLRQNSCRLDRISPGAVTKDGNGKVLGEIQSKSSSEIAAA